MTLSLKIFSSVSLVLVVLLTSVGESLGRSRTVEIESDRGEKSSELAFPQLIALEETAVEGRLDENSDVLKDNSYYNSHFFEGKAGETITIELISEDFDAYLIVENPEGDKIAENDDGGKERNARIIVTLPIDGTYEIIANTHDEGETGNYSLTWRAATSEEIAEMEAQIRSNNPELAIEYYEQSLAVAREAGDRDAEREALGSLGFTYQSLEDYVKALEYYEQALEIASEIGDRERERGYLHQLGSAAKNLEDYVKALEYYERAVRIARETGNREGEIFSLGLLGGLHWHNLQEYTRAAEYYKQALEIASEIRDESQQFTFLWQLGRLYSEFLEEYETAIEYYEQLRDFSEEVGYKTFALIWLGANHSHLGQYTKAIEYYEQAIALLEKEGNNEDQIERLRTKMRIWARNPEDRDLLQQQKAEADRLFQGGLEFWERQQFPEAVQSWEEASLIYQEINDKFQEAPTLRDTSTTYYSLANAYYFLGDYPKAIDLYEKALPLFQILRQRTGTAPNVLTGRGGELSSLIGLGNVYRALGNRTKALDYYQKSLQSLSEEGVLKKFGQCLPILVITLWETRLKPLNSTNALQPSCKKRTIASVRENLRSVWGMLT